MATMLIDISFLWRVSMKARRLWSGNRVSVERRRWRIFVTGVIDKGDDHAKE